MRDHSLLRGILGTAAVFLAMVLVLMLGLSQVDSRNTQEQTSALEETILRATLTCYAVEGRYPSDVSYLEAHYGVTYDHDRYLVVIDAFAENLLPDIRVLTEGGD